MLSYIDHNVTDNKETRQRAFNVKLFNNELSTLEKLKDRFPKIYENDSCIHCNLEKENQVHVLTCSKNLIDIYSCKNKLINMLVSKTTTVACGDTCKNMCKILETLKELYIPRDISTRDADYLSFIDVMLELIPITIYDIVLQKVITHDLVDQIIDDETENKISNNKWKKKVRNETLDTTVTSQTNNTDNNNAFNNTTQDLYIPTAQIQNPNAEILNAEIPNPKSQIIISIFCRNPKSQILIICAFWRPKSQIIWDLGNTYRFIYNHVIKDSSGRLQSYPFGNNNNDNDNNNDNNNSNEKTISIYVYEKRWRSNALIKLFNERIDLIVKDVCKKHWTLNTVALMRKNWDQSKIVIYDPDTEEEENEGEEEDNTDEDEDDDDDGNDLIIDNKRKRKSSSSSSNKKRKRESSKKDSNKKKNKKKQKNKKNKRK
ncbi:hypothetical protein Glove_157g57 [Diversispora epigaea]|uniref:Uncharacterized protein n=1 Tax=Diversispora epigaea TaxID=1348612 RepID=A0A397IRR8_9GLOM|nr:hypothetical protein Glove_157g57 [Diversispora epigaea]